MVTHIKNVSIKSCQIFKKNKNGHFIFGFFYSDLSKMDQTCKFGEQTSQILEFKPQGLDFYDRYYINKAKSPLKRVQKILSRPSKL